MWSSVICEIRTFKGLLPLLHCNWSSPWSGFVIFTDASEYGWGIVSGHLDPEVVARHGRVKERSCWKCGAELAPRRTALENMQKVTTPMPNGSSLPREATPTPSIFFHFQESESATEVLGRETDRRYSSYFCALWTIALVSAVHGFHIHAVSVIFRASLLNMNMTGHVVDIFSSKDFLAHFVTSSLRGFIQNEGMACGVLPMIF